MRFCRDVVIGMLTVAALAPFATAAMFSDGGFETPDLSAPTLSVIGGGGTFGPWTLGGAGGIVWNNDANVGHSEEGSQYLTLNNAAVSGAGTVGDVNQTFDVLPSSTYLVQFEFSALSHGLNEVYQVQATATGNTSQTYSYDSTGIALNATGPYLPESYTFTTGPSQMSTTLDFASLVPSVTFAYGPALDAISVSLVSTVPEPSSLVLFGFSALTLYGVIRRRRSA